MKKQQTSRSKKQRRSYFSLMEIIVALAIIALLASIATPLYFRHLRKAKISTAKSQIRMFEQALVDYRLDVGKLPDESNGLKALVENVSGDEKWDGPYLKRLPLDPWSNDYIYTIPGENSEYEIKSYGSDGQPGGEKDAADISSNQ
ncbi:MAG: type II secretion system major pseudopilin GspG [Victivallaceae bacterium]|nr:type II secretion system major pseudopilin GspG [Victivallaceae bacterium]